jgi:hypothetical protein
MMLPTGLQERSCAEMLGALINVAKCEDSQKWAAWSQAGSRLLLEKEQILKKTLADFLTHGELQRRYHRLGQ